MEKQPPSIFNDVLGPVMRGPSSSHTAASVRIGLLVRQCLGGRCRYCKVDFDPAGSLASTYRGQGADIGLAGGLLGMNPADPGLLNALEITGKSGCDLKFHIEAYPALHPNTYRITAAGEETEELQLTFISTGGGMIELQQIGRFPVSIAGDYYEALFFLDNTDRPAVKRCREYLEELIPDFEYCTSTYAGRDGLIQIKTGYRLAEEMITAATRKMPCRKVIQLEPVLPVLSRKRCAVLFSSAGEMLGLAETDNPDMWQLAVRYESARGALPGDKVYQMAEELVQVMKASVREGLAGTTYANRILGPQAMKLTRFQGRLIGGPPVRSLMANISAVMETKSAMGVIVAAPTAGSCGVLPGALLAAAAEMGLSDDDVVKGLLAAGAAGLLIAAGSTFAAEECGCQAECGSASGMAAAGLVQMAGGTVEQALDAASMALQNILGMVCDPVAERVEVPCLGKNVLAGLNAVGCANMALAGFDKVIPLDETIAALDQAGRMLPPELRCTGGAGLSITKTAREIHRRLGNRVNGGEIFKQ